MDQDYSTDPDELIGHEIDGRYRVVECIGEGGMGAVYVAEHLKLQKQVALKVIHPDFAGHEAAAQRFAREAMVTSRFQHAHIISATDYGALPGGGAYLVMELVHGRSVTEILEQEGSVPWARACDLASQVADALTAARTHAIVHRDLKPDNVLVVANQDGSETVKVLDFGIAKFSESIIPPPMGAQVTREGMVIGTPGYMAPEQAIGERTDYRADLYALGVVLWEMIVGQRLFAGEDLKSLIRHQLSDTPASVRAASEDLTVPDELDNLVAAMLRREAGERPANPAEVRDLLRMLAAQGRGSGLMSLPDVPLAERLAHMADVAKRAEDRTPSGIVQTTPMTGEQAQPSAQPQRNTKAGALLALLVAVAGGALVYSGQLEVRPKGELEEITTRIAPDYTPQSGAVARPVGAAEAPAPAARDAIGASGLPGNLEPTLETLVAGEARGERVEAAEALLAHIPMDEIPGYVRLLAHFQLEASCGAKKEQLDKLIAHPDHRALPALVLNSQRAKGGCGAAGKDCLACMRTELDALIAKLEAEVLEAE